MSHDGENRYGIFNLQHSAQRRTKTARKPTSHAAHAPAHSASQTPLAQLNLLVRAQPPVASSSPANASRQRVNPRVTPIRSVPYVALRPAARLPIPQAESSPPNPKRMKLAFSRLCSTPVRTIFCLCLLTSHCPFVSSPRPRRAHIARRIQSATPETGRIDQTSRSHAHSPKSYRPARFVHENATYVFPSPSGPHPAPRERPPTNEPAPRLAGGRPRSTPSTPRNATPTDERDAATRATDERDAIVERGRRDRAIRERNGAHVQLSPRLPSPEDARTSLRRTRDTGRRTYEKGREVSHRFVWGRRRRSYGVHPAFPRATARPPDHQLASFRRRTPQPAPRLRSHHRRLTRDNGTSTLVASRLVSRPRLASFRRRTPITPSSINARQR
ncbi:hypothetical protein B0H12DRAFT_1119835 [Mycena haematopus]|nr:hypothetical protein B0H12DRAFT_1119806 [Mycena haematopus]KAJ7251158.1 hypothetical protein B0H12DRAFT_1119835 [Mycena haematopus]